MEWSGGRRDTKQKKNKKKSKRKIEGQGERETSESNVIITLTSVQDQAGDGWHSNAMKESHFLGWETEKMRDSSTSSLDGE